MGMMIQRVQRILLWILVSLMFFFCTRQSRIELSAPADLECIWACLENQFKTSFIYLFLNKKWWVSFMLKLFLKFCSHPSLIDSSKFHQSTCHMCKQSHTKQAYKQPCWKLWPSSLFTTQTISEFQSLIDSFLRHVLCSRRQSTQKIIKWSLASGLLQQRPQSTARLSLVGRACFEWPTK